MSALVVDASAIFPLLSAGPDAERVADALAGHELHAPDFLALEVANALWKNARFGDWSWDQVERARATFFTYSISLVPTLPLVEPASALARRVRDSVYDCTYLALAVQLDGTLLTADARFAAAVSAHPDLTARVRVLPV